MGNWHSKVRVKRYFTDSVDHSIIVDKMAKVATELERANFPPDIVKSLRKIPKGDNTFSAQDYANKYLGQMYDYADANRIWIE